MWRQVQFKDPDGEILGGIALYEEQTDGVMELKKVICGCCGSTFEPDEVEIIQVYGNWIDLCNEIIGE